VSVVLRFLGWLGVIVALVVIGIAISSLTSGVSHVHSPNESEAMRTLFQIFGGTQGLITGLTSLISAFFMVGFGEVFVALRDMARNSFVQRG
jgi:hypothetical protein